MREIYCIRFNKIATKDDLHVTTYTLGAPVIVNGMLKTPQKIVLKDDKITTTFDDNTRHIVWYTTDVEIFEREKEKKDANKDDSTVK